MFTGLVEEIGKIKSLTRFGGGLKLEIACTSVLKDIKLGDSICVEGVCQTAVHFDGSSFTAEAVEETLKKTTFKNLKSGTPVNLETSLTLEKKLGGHFVLGHVDCVGKITSIKKLSSSALYSISFPDSFSKYIVHTGSIALNGVSLTVADYSVNNFTVSIIPHTLQVTTLNLLKTGDEVNLEFDILSKYVEKNMNGNREEELTLDKLLENGFQ